MTRTGQVGLSTAGIAVAIGMAIPRGSVIRVMVDPLVATNRTGGSPA
jgi:hypothetical protein